MICPYCETVNRDELDSCCHCRKDLSMLRLIVNRAKHHYNLALEHAERGRNEEALVELQNALELDSRHPNAHVLLGTIYARTNRLDEAREEWRRALALEPSLAKAQEYLAKSEVYGPSLPALRFYRGLALLLLLAVAVGALWAGLALRPDPALPLLDQALQSYRDGQWGQSRGALSEIRKMPNLRPESSQVTEMMSTVLDEQVQLRRQAAVTAAQRRDYEAALREMDYLVSRNLGGEEAEQIRRARESLVENAQTEIERILAQYSESGVGYERLMLMLDRLEAAKNAGVIPIDVDELRRKAQQIAQTRENQELALIQAEWFGTGNDEATLVRLLRLMSTGEPADEVKDFYNRILKRVQETRNRKLDELVEAGRASEAQAYLEESVAFLPTAAQKAVLDGIRPVSERVAELKARQYWREVSTLAEQGQWAAFLERAGEAEDHPLAPAQLRELETSATVARAEMAGRFMSEVADLSAAERWEELLKRAGQAESLTLSEAQKRDLDTSATWAREQLASALVGQIEDMAQAGQWTGLLEKAAEAESLALGPPQAEKVEEAKSRAREELAGARAEEIQTFMRHCASTPVDAKFDNPPGGAVALEDAQRLVQDWDEIRAQIAETETYRLRQFQFYRAVAAFVLGRSEEAKDLFQAFVQDYKDGRMLDYLPSAERYLQLLEQSQP